MRRKKEGIKKNGMKIKEFFQILIIFFYINNIRKAKKRKEIEKVK
jgi:hypothetical protein